ncbi:hypothetical protein [Saccharopolyspora spinosa]|uniref:hypothetical protein n=1 Tax=Saccharopolyspora spinosa TaxID=60894 RepID=UPI0002379249|nr:hypothetical protein [Saccharopolyspora spinosa]
MEKSQERAWDHVRQAKLEELSGRIATVQAEVDTLANREAALPNWDERYERAKAQLDEWAGIAGRDPWTWLDDWNAGKPGLMPPPEPAQAAWFGPMVAELGPVVGVGVHEHWFGVLEESGKEGADGSVPGGKPTRDVPVVPGSGQDRQGTPVPAHPDGVVGFEQDRQGTPPPVYSHGVVGSGQDRPGAPLPAHSDGVVGSGQDRQDPPPPDRGVGAVPRCAGAVVG